MSREMRDFLEKSLRRNLIGPGFREGTTVEDAHEILKLKPKSAPDRWYLTGYISPRCLEEEEEIPPEITTPINTTKFTVETSDDSRYESTSELGGAFSSRSIGLSTSPTEDCDSILVKFEWGEYKLTKKTKEIWEWSRTPMFYETVANLSNFEEGETTLQSEANHGLRFQIKRTKKANKRLISVRVINDRTYERGESVRRAESTIHQMKISLKGKFQDVRHDDVLADREMNLLYHQSDVLSYGHNIGANWTDRGDEVYSDYIPRFEIPKMMNKPSLSSLIPKFSDLTEKNNLLKSINKIKNFINNYEQWIKEQNVKFNQNPNIQRYKKEFENNMRKANENIIRMRRGVNLLLSNPDALEAFRLANLAIWKSQTDAGLNKIHRIEGFEWRPFQFAFILVNLEGVINQDSTDREIVDLAWFPTGGGKTEAYLGLIAILSFFRRINPETSISERNGPSIHTIMRYTLRLLTSDQAGRLVRAIGSMNHIALSEDLADGFTPFRVGMWVGRAASPNRLFSKSSDYTRNPEKSANDIILDAGTGAIKPESSISQFQNCPWCGDPSIGVLSRYSIRETSWSEGRPTLHTSCANDDCIFSTEFPFTCVDDDIYLNPPTVLLATADKFVQIAYNHSAKSIKNCDEFNSINGEDFTIRRMLGFEDHPTSPPPPDLVIQDELHLLTGPLGTVAGLFETGLDLCWKETCNSHRIKYIAATATIRGAQRDVGLMYGRELNVFPPPLLTAKDNFFSQENPTTKESGRLHLGILSPTGKALTSADQTAASILQSVSYLRGLNKYPDKKLDQFWTLVMYYNSLRELGGGQSSLTQNIPRWMKSYSTEEDTRQIRLVRELTSNRSSTELTQYRSDLNRTLTQGEPIDVLTTSNMFQVGIDIPRLSAMMILGQPRSNSEYIQSSGRVGRDSESAGLVISVLRGTYPRDQSHYEMFRAFHQEFYRHVDMTSITPFASRALDRAFPTTMMMMLRMASKELAANDGPYRLARRHEVREMANHLVQTLSEEVKHRMNKYELDDIDRKIIDGSIESMKDTFKQLKQHSKRHNNQGQFLHWIVWNEASREDGARSFFTSPFRPNDMTGNEDFSTPLSSMRDVSEEVLLARSVSNYEHHFTMSLPESHLFGHASPGSIWEHGGSPFLTGGISKWILNTKQSTTGAVFDKDPQGLVINEPVLTQIFQNYKFLKLPKTKPEDISSSTLKPNTPAVEFSYFPTNWICSDSEKAHIEFYPGDYIKEEGWYRCKSCEKPTSPSRFISLCEAGHVSNFDYYWWAHYNSKTVCSRDKAKLVLNYGPDASFSLRDWVVECLTCGAEKDMNDVPYLRDDDPRAGKCFGQRPWLHRDKADQNPCGAPLKNRKVGNTSITFNESSSLMLIPPYVTWRLADHEDFRTLIEQENSVMMRERWKEINQMKTQEKLKARIIDHIRDNGWGSRIDDFLDRLDEYRKLKDTSALSRRTMKSRERRGYVLMDSDMNNIDLERFQCRPVVGNSESTPAKWSREDWPIRYMSRIDRLTELRVVRGLRRLDPNSNEDIQPIDMHEVRGGSDWNHGIAMYNYGEGVFFDIKPNWLEKRAKHRNKTVSEARARMSFSLKNIHPGTKEENPALRSPDDSLSNGAFTIIHTLSHLIIRELSAISGFSLGSIRERIYLDVDKQAGTILSCGILIYTSGASSDGTLGGLVQQASSVRRIENIINRALEKKNLCSNDPVCLEHEPLVEEPNGAACHSCVFLPETSCEFNNQMLDRNWG